MATSYNSDDAGISSGESPHGSLHAISEMWGDRPPKPAMEVLGFLPTDCTTAGGADDLLIPARARDRIPTGLPSLDYILGGGVQPGKLNLLCAYSGAGKSSIAGHLACTAVGFGFGVILLHDFDMTIRDDYGPRFLAWMSGHSFSDIARRKVEIAPQVAAQLTPNIHFVNRRENAGDWNQELRKSINSAAPVHPEGLLVIVDSMDRLHEGTAFSSERVALENVVHALSDIAQEFQVPIWATTQANDFGDEVDTLRAESIRGARGKQIPASLVLGMGRSVRSEEIVTLTSIKSRDTPSFQIRIRAEFACQRFIDLSDALIPPQGATLT